jgi:glycosyltransferase involved in cell wall biosynthesis
MAKVLRDDGHAVTILTPDGAEIEGCRSEATTPQSIAARTLEADAAVVQGHAANDLFTHGKPVPAVVDLYDPFIIENLHYHADRGAEVFNHDHATLIRSLMQGDLFLCASEAQRMFYLGTLLAVGRLSPIAFETDEHLDSLLRIAPFGVQPPREIPLRRTHDILFGGIYDWYDPIVAIEAVAIARRACADATLTFTMHPNPELTPQGRAAEAMAHAKSKGYDFVRFIPWVPYTRRAEFYDRFFLALLTFRQSIETDLSMRTRIYDYLWSGIPIVTSSAPGTDEILERYDAGTIVHADSPEAFARELTAILENSLRYDRMVAGAKQFVRDHQWSRTLGPLREFCSAPRFDRSKEAFAVKLQSPERPSSILDRLKRRIGGAF